jgi:hypothetical protein
MQISVVAAPPALKQLNQIFPGCILKWKMIPILVLVIRAISYGSQCTPVHKPRPTQQEQHLNPSHHFCKHLCRSTDITNFRGDFERKRRRWEEDEWKLIDWWSMTTESEMQANCIKDSHVVGCKVTYSLVASCLRWERFGVPSKHLSASLLPS